MTTAPDDLKAILDRIAIGIHTETDLATLRTLIVSGDRNVVQLGKYNLNITEGRDIQVGDRIYQGPDAEAIKAIFCQVLDEYNSRKNIEVEDKKSCYLYQTVYSTLLPVSEMPRYIYGVKCQYNDLQTQEAAQEIIYPTISQGEMYPFLLRGGMLFCFQNLKNPKSPFRQLVDNQKVKRYEVSEWCEEPELRQWFITLLNRSLNKLTGRKGLYLDKIHHRYYFQSKELGQTLEVSYCPLNKSTTSRKVVWQPIIKKTGQPRPYWFHLAVALKFHEVGSQQWCLSIRPEMRVTKDGVNLIDSDKIGRQVTRKKSRIFNYDLLEDVNFWRYFLSDGQPRIIFPFEKGQRIIVSSTMMQGEIEWPGIPEEYAKPFKNVEYPEDLFSLAALANLKNDDLSEVDNWEDWDSDEDEEQEEEDEF
ncbi:hypothetical protein [Iningainema tapete]|uniref:Effector-associated domain-containing protein n=1 Tax=Iningainema tapete BLCC-T55 TaxID=2748662 RepID=A0A8J7CCW6_9CYAN|nr:hypothetical protein [Iningainema tapete]MBD2772500.1 hypothetical protein [Iningainema tapete BLCC-T55]